MRDPATSNEGQKVAEPGVEVQRWSVDGRVGSCRWTLSGADGLDAALDFAQAAGSLYEDVPRQARSAKRGESETQSLQGHGAEATQFAEDVDSSGDQGGVGASAKGVAGQGVVRVVIVTGEHFGQHGDIGQAQIQALTGQRMDRAGGVADQADATGGQGLGLAPDQRQGVAFFDRGDGAEDQTSEERPSGSGSWASGPSAVKRCQEVPGLAFSVVMWVTSARWL